MNNKLIEWGWVCFSELFKSRWTTQCKICVLSCALYHTIAEFGNGLIIHSIYFQDHNVLTFMQNSLLRIFFLFLLDMKLFFSGRSDILGTVIWIVRLECLIFLLLFFLLVNSWAAVPARRPWVTASNYTVLFYQLGIYVDREFQKIANNF